MKHTLLALALAAAVLPSFAQTAVDSTAGATSGASVGDIGITAIMNMPSASPFGAQTVNYARRYRIDGPPVAAVPSAFSSPAVWRCSTAGGGAAAQGRDIGLSFAWGGSESEICGLEFRIAIGARLVELRVGAEAEKDATKAASMRDAYLVGHAIACADEKLANSFERTTTMQCAEPTTTDERKARWARERESRARAAAAMGQPAPVASVKPLPPPYTSGG